ncbi:MAG: hypothetical protein H0U18_03435 [Pyrinomonadaceae bacterium]|nr:hypothetical protein [Pyrinomonadaceae bacterium]
MSDNAILVRNDAGLTVQFSVEALEIKDSALALAGLIGRVSNAEEQESAVTAQRELKRVLKLSEDARKAAKAPVLDYGRKIDSTAEEFVKDLAVEDIRVSKLIANFQALESARVRAAEAAKQTELNALEVDRQKALADAKSHDELDRVNQEYCERVAALPVIAPARVEGQVVREDWEIQVTDIHTLYRAFPFAVDLKPRLSEIRQLLDAGSKVPGVSAKKVSKASVRISKERDAINV